MERRTRMWTRRTTRIARTTRRRSRDGGGEEMDGGKRGRAGGGGRVGGEDMDGEEGEETRKGRRRGGMEDEEVRGGGGDKEDEEGQEEEAEQEEEEEEEEETKRRREEETWRMRKGRRSKIALEKSELFLSEISFLGYVVTRGGLRPDSRKVAAVKDALVPTSMTQVRAFLRLASYYRRFIKGFVAIARPPTNLLRKDQPFSWDTKCEQAFATLKGALATAPVFIWPDPTKQFILITDWQPEAIFAILAQKGNNGREHVIEYASRTVSDEQRNDSAPQGEFYAIVRGIQHFHPYLYGHKFLLVTDHESLLTLKKLTNYTGMIGWWAVRLQEHDFDIIHRKTERHGNADGLTHLHHPAKVPKREEIILWKEPESANGPKYGQVAVLPRGKRQSSDLRAIVKRSCWQKRQRFDGCQ
ncbi:hypothetical protein CBR_g38976 [Chara braunii]|uniref:Reverse transcriptase/retrotransposon-derived protein RNase H-like domain-containing protein n=1 Tax=Chara braunii TaxID=69332 RepID=A0A388K0T5_CHABU|nr:hypothetical protein CBR_g38976 [Chara braunii]|eukprot:GBG63664.1 hypothetical protein CBR_g38976 [Chara braunii]